MDLQKIRIFVIVLASLMAVLTITLLIDFENLSWTANKTSYIILIGNLAVIISVLSSYFYQRKKLNP